MRPPPPPVPVRALQPGENWKLVSNGIPSDMSSTYRTIPKFRAYEIVSRLYLRRRIHQNCHSPDVGHGGRVYCNAGEKWEKKIIGTCYIADV